jgi:hypothetical protein
MARSVERHDADVRDHLLVDAAEFRKTMSTTLAGFQLDNGGSVWDLLSHRVDALLDGRQVELSRYELPDWQTESRAGRPDDRFVLGADDVLRPVEQSSHFVPPNRAERRELLRRLRRERLDEQEREALEREPAHRGGRR